MTAIKGKVVAVTGAGSGIGRALASALCARGAHVALSDVDERGLAETASGLHGSAGRVTTHRVDVRDREAVEAYARAVREAHGGADIIINNAGVSVRGSIEELDYDDFKLVIDVNLWGVVHGTRAFLPLLREREAGHIVNVASINSMVPLPKNGPYNMSKYAVYGFSETLMQELRGSTIRVTSVHPGAVRTNIARNTKHASDAEAEYFEKLARVSSPEAAEVILRAVERNRERCFVGTDAHVMDFAKRILPGFTVRWTGSFAGKQIR